MVVKQGHDVKAVWVAVPYRQPEVSKAFGLVGY